MRTLSFSDCIELSFSGSVLKNAICFGDCDNDGYSELILGTITGDLFIYREDKCVCCATDLGTISAVVVGDLLNINRNVVVAVTVEGWCHVFDIQYEINSCEKIPDMDYPQPGSIEYSNPIAPFHSQRIVCNTRIALIGDVNGDGLFELIVGLTDRVLRTYQWKLECVNDEMTGKEEKEEDIKLESEVYDGRLYAMNKWEFASQIGSIALHRKENRISILVGQPGGSVTKITETPLISPVNDKFSSGASDMNVLPSKGRSSSATSQTISQNGSKKTTTLEYSILRNPSPADNILLEHYELDKANMRNENISTEVAGNVSSNDDDLCDSYAVATTDGTIIIAKGDAIERTFHCDHHILALHQLNGKVIFVGWEGDTYIMDKQITSTIEDSLTRFHFDESVAGFVVGLYGMNKEDIEEKTTVTNTYCMAFVTFHGKVYVYPNPFLA